MNRQPDDLQTKIKAAAEAAVKSVIKDHYQPLIDRKEQELRDLKRQFEQDLERWQSNVISSDGTLRLPSVEEVVSPPLDKSATQNGSSGIPTRRKMLLGVLPNFSDQNFIRRDAEAAIFGKWPEAEPKSESQSKSFTAGIATLMTDLVSRGVLEATEPENPFNPRVYTLTDEGKAELLKSGP